MIQAKAIRVRMERLLAGNAPFQEVGLLLSDVRFLDSCPAEVRDLPDFAAHRFDKNKGHTFENSNKLFSALDNYMTGRTASFTAGANYGDIKVVDALKQFLISKRIFRSGELLNIAKLVEPIAFYGLVSLHGCKLQGKGAPTAILALRLGSEGTLEMGCAAPTAFRPDVFINLNVFSTTLRREATTGRLNRELPASDANTTIEVNGNGLLQYLE